MEELKKQFNEVMTDFLNNCVPLAISNKELYFLLQEWKKETGLPYLINTSLNINGPIAESPNDAFNFFLESGAKCIVLNNWIIELKK